MALGNEKPKILGSYLKSRRERMKPDPADIVGRFGRRRTPGLRREEVAHLAGVSITWYTWLEQGRVTTTSREVIESIGRALQLSPEEHLHLLHLANYGGEGDARPQVEDMNPALQNIIDQLHYPAIIANTRTEVLAFNRMASEIIVDFDEVPAAKRVMTRLVWMDPSLRKQLVNWKEFADYTLGVFRSNYDQQAGDPWFEQFVRELSEESEEFQALWRRHEVQHKKAILYTFDHPGAGRLFFELISFSHLNGNPGFHCCVFTPIAGTDTELKLAGIRA
ncbi:MULTISPECIES: helix-turn-helix transcriptional regulator [Paenibacillus]|uniref:helix-turn-helix transcriptional regulator n=1 Tax=Paenibacillus TaxID=44249 RepID=UPI0022B864CE|nr:helix-turn-helix transcriptional regulator [Paenibacillus caseinilyticus]MCZ8522667.1 helix-turn-helix transcriptional regulator [Paenibacillus caseinilyticus]